MFSSGDYHAALGLRLISTEEVRCIRELAAQFSLTDGLLVDAGSFLGGATLALAEGVQPAGISINNRRIVAIDRFTASDDYIIDTLLSAGIGIRPEQSFLSLFLANISSVASLIEVRAGDLVHVGEVNDKIDLLVLDIVKTSRLNSFVLLRWFNRLVSGTSIIYNQDFHCPFYLWNAVNLGVFKDCLEIVIPKVGEAAVFKVVRPMDIISLASASALSPLSAAGLAAIRSAVSMFPQEERHTVQLAEVVALVRMKRHDEARLLFESIINSPFPKRDSKWLKWTCQIGQLIEKGRIDRDAMCGI